MKQMGGIPSSIPRFGFSSLLARGIGINFLVWIPGLLFYLWLTILVFSHVQFPNRAHKLEAIMFLGFQTALVFSLLACADGLLSGKGNKLLRFVVITLCYFVFAALYVDFLLYHLMSVHLGRGVGILFQGGFSRVPLNWAHTGISNTTFYAYVARGVLVAASILLYSAAVVYRLPRVGPVIRLGRLMAAIAYASLVSQMLSCGDDVEWKSSFGELSSALPLYVGKRISLPGRRFRVPPLALRNQNAAPESGDPLMTSTNRPDIFLFILESARGDFVLPDVTPNLTRFSAESLTFRDALASGNASHISWYSLLTANFGLFFSHDKRLAQHQGSIPIMLFKRLGYKINVLCSSTLDYHDIDKICFGENQQLCDFYFDAEKQRVRGSPARDIAVNENLLRQLDLPPGGRLFLIFYHSTHHDYDWPAEEPAYFAPYAMTWKYADFTIGKGQLLLIMNRYRNALHFQDKLIGEVFSKLRSTDQYRHALISIVGDHGEEFLEHGRLLHASNLYRPQTHIPFFVKLPDEKGLLSSLRHQLPAASHVDLLPTLLDYLGLTTLGYFDGQSLFKKTADRVVITAENGDDDPVCFCVQTPECKGFFQYENGTRSTTLQNALYLTQITDFRDKTLPIDLFGFEGMSLTAANFDDVFHSLFLRGVFDTSIK